MCCCLPTVKGISDIWFLWSSQLIVNLLVLIAIVSLILVSDPQAAGEENSNISSFALRKLYLPLLRTPPYFHVLF
jgi:hypothetical protein